MFGSAGVNEANRDSPVSLMFGSARVNEANKEVQCR